MVINALSFDVEEWYHAELVKKSAFKQVELVQSATSQVLEMLNSHGVKATFFILGDVVKKTPNVLKKIYDEGHEIASHGYSHTTLYELNPKSFEKELIDTENLIWRLVEVKPIGFRAPCFSLNNSTKWALDVLERNDYVYDSSIFPIKTHLYGVPNAPREVYKPSKKDVALKDPSGKIFEVPLATARLAELNIPIAGGFYLRALPLNLIKRGIRQLNEKKIPAVMYAHPWELHSKTPKVNTKNAFSNFVTYWNLGAQSLKKLDSLLREFKFAEVKNVLPKTS